MDFSSDVLIDFGLNLAGYLVAILLIYTLLGRRNRRQEVLPQATTAAAAPATNSIPGKRNPVIMAGGDPEFIPLSTTRDNNMTARAGNDFGASGRNDDALRPITAATRKDNRRAIYQEARRLLAAGRSQGDLMRQLPLTEGELEMLSVTGKA